MKSVFVNASEGTCGYHVVHMGWKSNRPNCVNVLSPQKLRMWSLIVQHVHKWLYSWMTPGNVEDKEEYELSKYLLEKFICLQIVLDVVGEHRFLVYKVIKIFGITCILGKHSTCITCRKMLCTLMYHIHLLTKELTMA